MFERFTDRARRVMVLAQEEARNLDHNYIGTEHLLLGLLRENDGIAAQALKDLGMDLAATRAAIEAIVPRGNEESKTGHIPFTTRAKKVLELSLRQALALSHNYIGTEHILLGLVQEGEGVAAQVLLTHGAELQRVRGEVLARLPAAPGLVYQPPADPDLRTRMAAVEGALNELTTQVRQLRERLEKP